MRPELGEETEPDGLPTRLGDAHQQADEEVSTAAGPLLRVVLPRPDEQEPNQVEQGQQKMVEQGDRTMDGHKCGLLEEFSS
jgi:hypothetical protein